MTASGSGAGRPRSGRVHQAILQAALEEVAEHGYEGLTMEGIAARAGVGKAAVYRRWGSRDGVLAAAAATFVRSTGVPDTGAVGTDLKWLVHGSLTVYRGLAGRVIPGLISALAHDTELAAAVREGFVASRREAVREVVERGIQRRELRQDIDIELTLDLLMAPLFYRFLITGAAVDEEVATALVDTVLRGIGAGA
jgi:AcrR family transcriptional regulator